MQQRSHSKGNRHDTQMLTFFRATSVLLADDQADVALESLHESAQPTIRFSTPTWRYGFGRGDVLLYQGRLTQALSVVEESWAGMRSSLMHWIPLVTVYSYDLTARIHLALAADTQGATRSAHLKQARKALKPMGGLVPPVGAPLQATGLACLAELEGQDAAPLWAEAEALLSKRGMGARLAAVRAHTGADPSGQELSRLGVVDRGRFVNWMLPTQHSKRWGARALPSPPEAEAPSTQGEP